MNSINHTGHAHDQDVGTKEADKGGDFEFACVQDNEAHNTSTDTGKDADKAIRWVNGRKKTVDDIYNTG